MRLLKLLIRLFPGLLSIWFGLIKIFGGQFTPTSVKLESIKDLHSPDMVFLFFGNSGLYIFVIGLTQLIGGLLIIYKKTNIIGAFIGIALYINIMLINYSFHFSIALTIFTGLANLCCILTLAFEHKRLKNLLVV